jgi:hypothetical protein
MGVSTKHRGTHVSHHIKRYEDAGFWGSMGANRFDLRKFSTKYVSRLHDAVDDDEGEEDEKGVFEFPWARACHSRNAAGS